jgi:hypothetical protein
MANERINEWRWPELLKGAILLFSIGLAWGTLMMSIRGIHSDMVQVESRTEQIEKYLITKTKGDFVPADPDGQHN